MQDAALVLLLFLVLSFLVLVGLFLLFRAFWLWYWKLDRIAADTAASLELLAHIRGLLHEMRDIAVAERERRERADRPEGAE